MQTSKKSATDFCIKLLSGKSVVLVESQGYESELFIPRIFRGRIDFQNIIPSRRCCNEQENISPKLSKKARRELSSQKQKTNAASKVPFASKNDNNNEANLSWRMAAGQDKNAPLAFSTPTGINHAAASVSLLNATTVGSNALESKLPPTIATTTIATPQALRSSTHMSQPPPISLPAPQELRSDVLPTTQTLQHSSVPTPYQVMKNTLVKIPSGIKIIRLYRDAKTGTPSKVGRLVNTDSSLLNTTCRSSPANRECSLHLPNTPQLSRRGIRRSVTNHTQSSLQKVVNSSGCIEMWRKCITPIRTYSRRSVASKHHRVPSGSKIKARPSKVIPTYLVNPTQGKKGTHQLDIRKRKLILDSKVTISPYSFKKQQIDGIDNLRSGRKAFKSVVNLRNTSVQALRPKNRRLCEESRKSAFDLLTNSNRADGMSAKLNTQFRKGCINKTRATNPKYKMLCALPPLKSNHKMHRNIPLTAGSEAAPNVKHNALNPIGIERRTGCPEEFKAQFLSRNSNIATKQAA